MCDGVVGSPNLREDGTSEGVRQTIFSVCGM